MQVPPPAGETQVSCPRAAKRTPRISIFLPNLGGGGAERVLTLLANEMVQRGYPVEMVLGRAVGPMLEKLSERIPVVDLQAKRIYQSVRPLMRYLRDSSPEILITGLEHANLAALLARRWTGMSVRIVPTVHHSHSTTYAAEEGLRGVLLRQAIRRCYPWADAIVAVSRGTAEDLIATMGIKRELVRVIHNPVIHPGVLNAAQEPVEHPWFAPGMPPVVLGMGRLTAQKDFPTLLRAFALLRRRVEARLVILGEGPARAELERLAEQLETRAHVDLPGFQPNPFAYMARCSVFALSSAWEALPTVLIEALALGARVVSTDCRNGPREILEGGRWGRLVPVGDPASLAAAIQEAIDEPAPAVPAEVLHPYTISVATERYLSLIRELCHA